MQKNAFKTLKGIATEHNKKLNFDLYFGASTERTFSSIPDICGLCDKRNHARKHVKCPYLRTFCARSVACGSH